MADSKVGKGFPNATVEGGVHVHALLRSEGQARFDGAHRHLFILPDGNVLVTESDGAHSHAIEPPEADATPEDGAHDHAVLLEDGEVVKTSNDGAHSHQLQVFYSAFDGLHQHTLELPDGTEVTSMSPGEFYAHFKDEIGDAAPPPAPPAEVLAEPALKSAVSGAIDAIVGDKNVAVAAPPDGKKDWRGWLAECAKYAKGEDAVLLVPEGGSAEDAVEIVEAVSKLDQPAVVGLRDTEQARELLTKIGTPFTVKSGDRRWIYASTHDVAHPEDIELHDAKKHVVKVVVPEGTEERFVMGIVLEPETVDAQKDIYSHDEVRTAAHKFMEDYRNMGLMHRSLVNDGVKILESFIAPVTFKIGDTEVAKGTWLLAVRITDDALWVACKEGRLTGFSMGGSAVRVRDA